jgi:hypothetical protein
MMERRIPPGPDGLKIDSCPLDTYAGTVRLRQGDEIELDSGTKTVLREIRRCPNGEIFGMVEFPDGGFLWHPLAPVPVPKPTTSQISEVRKLRDQIPQAFLTNGDSWHKVGERASYFTSKGRMAGTILLMAFTRPSQMAGTVIALDDGGLSISDDIMALVDGRIDVERVLTGQL